MATAGTQTPMDETVKSKRPSSSAFKQQRLPAWQPILTAGTVLPTFFVIGIAFIPIGIGLLISSDDVKERVVDYTYCESVDPQHSGKLCADVLNASLPYGIVCTCKETFTVEEEFKKEVFMYYGLTNYYQNHRRYVKSRDDSQLSGNIELDPNKVCKPFNEADGKPVAPCGAIANSLFNDSFSLMWFPDESDTEKNHSVPLDATGIAWPTDKNVKFRNPKGVTTNEELQKAFERYAPPPNWNNHSVASLSQDFNNNGFQNEDLIVWMRTAALPTFRKLYRRVNHTHLGFKSGLPKGKYELTINYAYPVKSFDGRKRMILSTTSWLGGKNPFLGIAYIVVGCICLGLGIVFLVIHIKFGKSTQDMVNITQRTGY